MPEETTNYGLFVRLCWRDFWPPWTWIDCPSEGAIHEGFLLKAVLASAARSNVKGAFCEADGGVQPLSRGQAAPTREALGGATLVKRAGCSNS